METRPRYQCIIPYRIIQVILGMLFVISGVVKGVDPIGVAYKIEEYIKLFGIEFLSDYTILISVVLCAVEIFIGVTLLVGIYRKFTAALALIFLTGFTAITFYLVIDTNAEIQECGCFGEAFKLTNIETLLKNIVFVVLAILYTWRQFRLFRVSSSSSRYVPFRALHNTTIVYIAIIALLVPFYSIYYLPPFDFLPFNHGVNILENIRKESVTSTDGVHLIYKNKESGEVKKFDLDDSTWQDSDTWEYVDMDVPEVEHENYLSKFVVIDRNGGDCSSVIFDDSDYNFIIIARDIEDFREVDFQKIAPLYKLYLNQSINLYLFTSSELDSADKKLSLHDLSMIKAYNVNEVVLKSMIRNDRGVILVSDGVIEGKWNLKQDSFKNLSENDLEKLVKREKQTVTLYLITISSFVLVLVALVLVEIKKERCVTGKK